MNIFFKKMTISSLALLLSVSSVTGGYFSKQIFSSTPATVSAADYRVVTSITSAEYKRGLTIYNYLKSHTKWNDAAICGIMTHLYQESNFSPTSTHEKSGAYGIAQWLDEEKPNGSKRKSNLELLPNHDTIEVQLDYLISEINSGAFNKVKTAIVNATNDLQGAYDTAYAMRLYFGWVIVNNTTKLDSAKYATNTDFFYPKYAQNPVMVRRISVVFHRNLNSSDKTTVTEIFETGVSGQKFGYKPDGEQRYGYMNDANIGFGKWENPGFEMLGWSKDSKATAKSWNTYSGVSDNWIKTNSPVIDLYAVWKSSSEMTSLSIEMPASKTTYWPYEAIQTSGLTLKATYKTGSSKTITSGFNVSADMTQTGTVPVTVSYTENSVTKTVTYDITVKHPFSGTGTESDPYLIQNKDDLVRLAKVINGPYIMTHNGTKVGFNNLYYKQTADIDLTGVNFTPIGMFYKDTTSVSTTDNLTSDNAFYGFYDGDGHTVSNLSLDTNRYYTGLFGKLTSGAIKNLAVTGNIKSTSHCAGGIVGEMGYGAVVSGCSFNGTVSGQTLVGGITGNLVNGGTVSECYANGSVTATASNGMAGGITGHTLAGGKNTDTSTNALIEKCYFAGSVKGGSIGTAAGAQTIGTEKACTITISDIYTSSGIKGTDDAKINKVSESDLKSLNGISLGSAFITSSDDQNNGFPVLAWQNPDTEKVEIPQIVAGDINNDGIIDMTDLSNLSLWLLGDMELNDGQLIAADATGDGSVDIADLSHFKMYISKGIGWIGSRN